MCLRSFLFLALLLAGSFSLNAEILYSVTALRTLPGGITAGTAINNAGQITGWESFTTMLVIHAVLYSNGQITDLGTIPGYNSSFGYSINNAGQVTGLLANYRSSGAHAFLYSNGQMSDLGTLGGSSSSGYGINNAGQVTGYSDAPGSFSAHAFLYSNGQMQDLGTLPGYSSSSGYGINNAGQVVGEASTSTGLRHAFLYSNGQMQDLNDLIDPALGITLAEATAINDNGQILVGPYLLTPVPEPSTLALFGLALLGLGAWVRVRRA